MGLIVRLLGILLVIGLVVLILKWVLITAAVLAVPFAIWWMWDRRRPRPGAGIGLGR